MTEEEVKKAKKSRWKTYLTIFTLAALGVLIIGLHDQIADVIKNLGKVNTWALLLMIPIQALNYDVYARFYRSLFKIFGAKADYKSMYRLSLELNFVNHILPSGGVSGISYFGVRMKSLQVSGAKSTLAQIMKFLLLYLSFLPILVAGLIFLAMKSHVNGLLLVVSSSIITLIIAGTFAGVYIIESRSRISSFLTFITRIINKIVHLVRPKYPETISIERAQGAFDELHDNYQLIKKDFAQLQWPLVYMTIANLTEIASLYVVYIAFGEPVNVGAVILAYAVANFAGLISVLPAGIGIYEGLMTAVLAATGIPPKLSIPVTIMYRVLNMTIQIVPGYILYQRAVKQGLTEKL